MAHQVDEIVEGVYRICSLPSGRVPIGFNQFLIVDERPALIHTGYYESYDVVRAAERLGGSVLVAAQVRPGLEILCGMHRDPLFGPVVVAGLGGALAEAAGIASRALAPLDDEPAHEMCRGQSCESDMWVAVDVVSNRLKKGLQRIEATGDNLLQDRRPILPWSHAGLVRDGRHELKSEYCQTILDNHIESQF